eukprot:2850974-Amphidinium_carterae.2
MFESVLQEPVVGAFSFFGWGGDQAARAQSKCGLGWGWLGNEPKRSGVDLKLDDGGLVCFQTNATKQGSLFRNMFAELGLRLELFGAPYIIGMQAHIPDPKVAENLWGLLPGNARLYRKYPEVATQDMHVLREACQSLLRNLAYLEVFLRES